MENEMIKTIKRLQWCQSALGLTDEILDNFIENGAYLDGSLKYWRQEILNDVEFPKTKIKEFSELLGLESIVKIFSKHLNLSVSEALDELTLATTDPLHLYNKDSYYDDLDLEDLIEEFIIQVVKTDSYVSISKIARVSGETRKTVREIRDKYSK